MAVWKWLLVKEICRCEGSFSEVGQPRTGASLGNRRVRFPLALPNNPFNIISFPGISKVAMSPDVIRAQAKPAFVRAVDARVYCDESGFTGNNLLDTEQPYFAYAGVMAEEDVTGDFIQKTIRDFDIQGDELKGSRLLRYNKGRQAVNVVLERFASSARVTVHEKRFALSTYFFEYVFEPALSNQNSIFYRANFHRFVAALMYAHLVVQHEPAGKLITSFFDMMNSLDIAKFGPLNSQQIVSIDERSPLDQIALFAFLHRAGIAKELSVVYGDGPTPNWILDLSVTSLFSILSAVGQEHQTIEVFCDESKPLLVNREIFDKMVNRPDMPRECTFGIIAPSGSIFQSNQSLSIRRRIPAFRSRT